MEAPIEYFWDERTRANALRKKEEAFREIYRRAEENQARDASGLLIILPTEDERNFLDTLQEILDRRRST